MATFTMQLKDVIEHLYGTSMDPSEYVQEYASVTFKDVSYGKLPILSQYDSIGLAYYPLFHEGYRKILNGKIIDEYYNQEICTETIDNFTLILRKKMDQIMPYYNQLYASQELEFDPLSTMDINSVGSAAVDGKEVVHADNVSETDSKSESRATNLNFPQTALAGNADYATSAVDSNSSGDVEATSKQDSDSTTNTESKNESRVTGYQGNLSNLIVAYRNSLLNIDTMVLDEIKDCFMLLHNNGDSYTPVTYYGWAY
jgi:hypothetical protein